MMKNATLNWLQILFFTFFISSNAFSQITAERTVPERGYFPGVSFPITLTINTVGSSKATLIEKPPAGWGICRLSKRGDVIDGVITWDLSTRTYTNYSITYFVTPPETANGDGTFSGTMNEQEISGMTTVKQGTPEPLGIFQNHVDIGFVDYSEAIYDSESKEYKITVGESPRTFDNGHFIYRKIDGDFLLQAHLHVENAIEDYETVGQLMIWDSLVINNTYAAMIENKPNGDCYSAWGEMTDSGVISHGIGGPRALANNYDGRLRMERNGDVLRTYYFDTQIQDWGLALDEPFSFSDPVYIGFFAMSWNGETICAFQNVELTTQSSVSEWELY